MTKKAITTKACQQCILIIKVRLMICFPNTASQELTKISILSFS